MKIKFMWKTKDSGGGNCPALYEAPSGYVTQGEKIDDETRAQLQDLAPHEDAVYVPADVIDRLVQQRIKDLGLA
ncbi:hypothetical protein AB0392_11210 [Nonomuraea angiospora]|uniref:hypothetical protein n=1 Tax=Nonomuraea angiospora TaxID=46172 RepID=UPI00345031BF